MYPRGSPGVFVTPSFINQCVFPWLPWHFCNVVLLKSMCFPLLPLASLLPPPVHKSPLPLQINVFHRGSLGIFLTPSLINQCVPPWSPRHFGYPFLYKSMCFPVFPWAFLLPPLYKSMFPRGSLGIFVMPFFINQCVSPWFPRRFCYPFRYKSMCFPMVALAFLQCLSI